MKRDGLIAAALFVLAIVLFAPARHHEFVNYDDPRYVLEPIVQRGLTLDGVGWAFSTFNFANYHPITWLSHMLDAQLFGTDPAGHHFSSVVLHAINAVVLFLLLRNLTGRLWESAAVGGLFAVHPLRVESVAWAAERKDLLFLLFFLLSIAAYARWVRKRFWIDYAIALVLFALSLMSKSMAVSLPIVLLLLDAWPLKRARRWGLVGEKVPFVVMSIAICVVTMIAQRQGGAMSGLDVSPGLRVANAIYSYGRYLLLTAWPKGLAVFYPYHGALPGTTLPATNVILTSIVLIVLTGLAIWFSRRNRAVMVGWLWFIVTLVPVIGIVQVGRQAMADRYTYLPHVGLFIAIVFGVGELVRARRSLQIPAAAITAIVIIVLFIRTRDQLRHWRNSFTLYAHALNVTTHNHTAHANLGLALFHANRFDEAIAQYDRAIAINPAEAQPYYNIGVIYSAMGRYDEARRWYELALERLPAYPEAQVGIGNTLLAQGREPEAIAYFTAAARLRPDYFDAQYNLGLSLARAGRIAEALPHFAKAVRLAPDHADARYSYALALHQTGQREEAKPHWDRARQLAQEQGYTEMLSQIERQLSPPASQPRTTQQSL